jgi:uncharacterized protein YndB with AHSA1/START domain
MPHNPSLTIRRTIKASRSAVYRAWTDPAELAVWMAPGEMRCARCEADVRDGGSYLIEMKNPDGGSHIVSGTYEQVVENEKLVFTWAWASTPEEVSSVTVLLRDHDEGTQLTLVHEQFVDDTTRDKHEGGWSACLDKLIAKFETEA